MLCDREYFASQLPALQQLADTSVASYPRHRSIAGMAADILKAAPLRFAAFGHSMGGRVAQELVSRAPERVIGIGLSGTDYRGFQDAEERVREESRRLEWLAMVDRDGFDRFVEQWAPRLVAPPRRGDVALISRISAMARRLGREGLDAHCQAGLSRPDYSALLPRIAVPALVMAASEDDVRPVQLHRDIASRIPGASLAIIQGSGHMMSMEHPGAVTAHMRSWLQRIAR
jgi:pimeloyl-ACP methyl ester carboxylesterase